VSRFLDEPRYRAYKRDYDEVALRSDLRIFLDLLPENDERAQARFGELAGEFLARVDREVLERLPAILRLKWHLVGRGLLPEVVEVLAYERRRGRIPVARRLWFRYGKYPFWRDRRRSAPGCTR
jgi:CDP-glycerol glycerophosphotransferase